MLICSNAHSKYVIDFLLNWALLFLLQFSPHTRQAGTAPWEQVKMSERQEYPATKMELLFKMFGLIGNREKTWFALRLCAHTSRCTFIDSPASSAPSVFSEALAVTFWYKSSLSTHKHAAQSRPLHCLALCLLPFTVTEAVKEAVAGNTRRAHPPRHTNFHTQSARAWMRSCHDSTLTRGAPALEQPATVERDYHLPISSAEWLSGTNRMSGWSCNAPSAGCCCVCEGFCKTVTHSGVTVMSLSWTDV